MKVGYGKELYLSGHIGLLYKVLCHEDLRTV